MRGKEAGLGLDESNNAGGELSNPRPGSAGAPPSNTAPAIYIFTDEEPDHPGVSILRYGIDSLYLSYSGRLASALTQRLEGLKRAAQSKESDERSNAQVKIGGHLFEVKDKGKAGFAFVLVDNCFHIQLSSAQSSVLPLAHVQIFSEMLKALSVGTAEEKVRYIINTLGVGVHPAQVSRVDLFVDFVSPFSMDGWKSNAWITRAHKIWSHYEKRQFSGWSIGLGGVLGARLYDKTLELARSKKDYLITHKPQLI